MEQAISINEACMPKLAAEIEAAEAQIRAGQQDVDYTVREYPVEVVVKLHTAGLEEGRNEIFVPDYQRDLVWEDERQSKFIESLLIGLPIPYLFVADVGNENEELAGRLEIVDGTQRIRTLARFVNNELSLIGLERLPNLNGFTFGDLPTSRQRRFGRITLRMIELTEKADEETRRDMFDRINTGSVRLNDMESRRGRLQGPFIDLISELANDERYKTMAPVSDAAARRYERDELVARFFAFRQGYQRFGLPEVGKVVSMFVDEYVKQTNAVMVQEGAGGATETLLRQRWIEMLNFVALVFGRFSKAKSARSTPRVRFEALSVGSSLALAENTDPPGARNVEEWLKDDGFLKLVTSDAANNRSRVTKRIEFVRDRLLGR